VFQFFCFSSLNCSKQENDPKNDPTYQWKFLSDMQPLNVTMTTDMAADWNLAGAGGGVKQTKMFCNLCTCPSSDTHQSNPEKCDRICHEHEDDPSWMCCHHKIFS
jgi:hypothetical protein